MSIFINRLLNLKKIKVIGFDMDHTIVRYKTENFEHLAFESIKEKLVKLKGYPQEILAIPFDAKRFIQGLIIDKPRGNILKLNRFSKVKKAYHGTTEIDFKIVKRIYRSRSIDFNDPSILALDTSFAISTGVMFTMLVDIKDKGLTLPDYETLAADIKEVLDIAHSDGTLKNEVKKDINRYIEIDPNITATLEKLKRYGKKLIIITNSDFDYTKFLMEQTITPFLKEHQDWSELFEYTITYAQKPRFFHYPINFLHVDPKTGLMSNQSGELTPGIYQGGNAKKLEQSLGVEGEEVLYFGDHIYGDVVSIKKTMNWRTALILSELDDEINSMKKAQVYLKEVENSMQQKEQLEQKLYKLYAEHIDQGKSFNRHKKEQIFEEIKKIDAHISKNIVEYQKMFNPYWGEITRAGQEESRFAGQVEKYACIYMTRITDLKNVSPRTYFRPFKRPLAHELTF
jgi:HAD superfamily 5'-nucleotidase-like hydrolase